MRSNHKLKSESPYFKLAISELTNEEYLEYCRHEANSIQRRNEATRIRELAAVSEREMRRILKIGEARAKKRGETP